MTTPRIVLPNATVLVTRRTLRRHHLFAPDSTIRQLYLYALGVCAGHHGILIHAVVLMSTHEHLVLTDTRGVLPDFLRDFHRLVALCTKILRKWEGAVWDHGRPSVVHLCTAEAIVEKIAYCMVNPVSAGLVMHARQWPGVTTVMGDLGATVLRIRRPALFFDSDNPEWPDEVSIEYTLPSALLEHGTPTDIRRRLDDERSRQEHLARTATRNAGLRFLGADRCSRLDPYRRARSFEPLRDRNPQVAVGRDNPGKLKAAIAWLRAFRSAYRNALSRWHSGIHDVLFPAGTWWMHRFHCASIELAIETSP